MAAVNERPAGPGRSSSGTSWLKIALDDQLPDLGVQLLNLALVPGRAAGLDRLHATMIRCEQQTLLSAEPLRKGR
jgi:hypothetical protein